MADETHKNLKIRFRFPGGEEFEAEGTPEFIEQQRNYFLALIGKNTPIQPKRHAAVPGRQYANSGPGPLAAPGNPFSLPQSSPEQPLPPNSASFQAPAPPASTPVQDAFPARRLWEKLLKEEGNLILLRRKMRLDAPEAALLILAGARVLLNHPAYSALSLSQALQKSGFTSAGRLDRLLAQEIKNGYLTSEGIKRGRLYRLSNQGFAHAFVLAEKLAGEML